MSYIDIHMCPMPCTRASVRWTVVTFPPPSLRSIERTWDLSIRPSTSNKISSHKFWESCHTFDMCSCSFLFVFIMSCSFVAALACVILSKQENLQVIWLHISIAFPESTGSLTCLAHLSNFSFLLWGIRFLKKSTSPRLLHWNPSWNYPGGVGPTHKMMVSAGLKPQALPFCAGSFKPLSKTCSQRTRRVDISPCQPALAKAQAKLARFNGLHLPHRKVTLSERSESLWHGMASVIYLYTWIKPSEKTNKKCNQTKKSRIGLDATPFPTNSTLKILDSILTPQFHRSNKDKDDHLLPKGRSGSMASRLKT